MKKMVVLVLAVLLAGIAVFATGIRYSGNLKIEPPASQRARMKQMPAEEKAMMRSMGINLYSMKGYSFEAMADGGHFKMVYTSSFAIFKKGSYVLGDSGRKVAYIVFPDRKRYVKLDLNNLQKTVSGIAHKTRMTYSNLKMEVVPLAPKVISGIPCTGKRIAVSYDVSTSIMGFHHRSREKKVTDYYTTSEYDAMKLFGGHNWHTKVFAVGYAPFDKVIASKIGFLGFSIMAKTRSYSNGKDNGTMTLTILNVRPSVISPSTFHLPSGYTQTTIGAMLQGSFRGRQAPGGTAQAVKKKKKRPSLKDILSGFNE